MTDVVSMIERATRAVRRQVRLLIGRCVLQAIDDGGGMQVAKLSLLRGERRKRVERMQEYGFTSHPHPGCEGAAVFVGGDRGHGIIVATDDRRHRKKGLAEGEVALYTDEGDYILLKRDRIIEVVAGNALEVTAPEVTVKAETKVTLDTPETELTGDLSMGEGDILFSDLSSYRSHTHSQSDDSDGNSEVDTDPPK